MAVEISKVVLVPHRTEGAAGLLVDEVVRTVEGGDAAGHAPADAEVAGAEGDLVPEYELPSVGAGSGGFPTTVQGRGMDVDVDFEVEHDIRLGIDDGDDLYRRRHAGEPMPTAQSRPSSVRLINARSSAHIPGFSEGVQVLFDASDQAADPVDFLLRGHGLGFRPLVRGGHRGDPFAVAQQVGEVCLQVRQIGDVAAEVLFRVKSGRVASTLCLMRSW
jgi:hypothetical protein